jgi:hypothetical protein
MRQRGEAYAGEDHRRPGPRLPSTAPIMVRFVEVVDFGLLTMDQVAAQLNPIARQWDEADGPPLARRFASPVARPLPLPA